MKSLFKQHINEQLPFLKEAKLLVACSGGVDSVLLIHLCHSMEMNFGVAHCNFQLRGDESDEDQRFVKDLCKRWDLPFYTESFDTEAFAGKQGVSIQMAARDLRYRWFDEILAQFDYDYVLTAHHLDDNLETFLINLSRGTGIRGLSGIPEQNQKIIRPLLPFTKDQILELAKSEGLFWREDSSNLKSDYLRNALRHKVIPPLKNETSGFASNFRRTQKHLSDTQALLDDYLALIYKLVVIETNNGYEIQIEKLKDLPNYQALLYELLAPFKFTAWKDVIDLLEAQSGKQIFSSTHRLLKDREVLLLTALESPLDRVYKITAGLSAISEPVSLSFTTTKKLEITNDHTAFLDSATLKFPLMLRRWQEGDRFIPSGMKGSKKLSKFFKDEKLSLVAKEKTWVLCSDNSIVWIVGMRVDERFKATKTSKQILKIVYKP